MCGLVVTLDDERVTKIRGDESHALSRGYTCPKGRALGALHHATSRLDHPLRRDGDTLVTTAWDEVLDDLASRITASIDEGGPDSVAMYLASGSAFDTAGRRAAERFLAVLGSRQKYTATTIDTPSKPLVAELVGGWSGLTPIWDHEQSTLLLLLGSNPVVSHGHSNAIPDPVRRLREFRAKGGAVWVFDPRRTESASLADRHLQLAPGTDWLVLGWLVRRLLTEHPAAASLAERATGVTELVADVEGFTDDLVTQGTGLAIDALEDLVEAILIAGRVSALTGTGVSMSSNANISEYLLWALHIVTDSYDRPGGMWFNPGFLSRLDRRRLPVTDGVPDPGPSSRPELPRRFGEYPCSALIPEIEAGNISTLLVVGGNPLTAFPDRQRVERAFSGLETLAVIDILPTETTHLATHVLPAVDQLERADLTWLLDSYQLAIAAQYTDAVVAPVAERRPVWWMFGSLGARLGIDVLPAGSTTTQTTDAELLAPLIDRSADPELLRSSQSLAVHSGAVFGWVTESVLPDRRWRLSAASLRSQLHAALEERTATATLVLIPSRRLRLMNSQFHDLSIEMGNDDMAIHASPRVVAELGTRRAILRSPEGSVTGTLVADDSMRDDCVTLSHGWGQVNVCTLTSNDAGIDPLTGMVRQSGFDVELLPAE